jgi:hypothetical protein
VYQRLSAVRSARQQALEAGARVMRAGKGNEIAAAAKAMSARLLTLEGEMTQLEGIGGQDTYYYPGMLDSQILDLYYEITNGERRMTSATIERWTDLQPSIADVLQRSDRAVKAEVDAFNALVKSKHLDAVLVKGP